jgi:hypothetical protein
MRTIRTIRTSFLFLKAGAASLLLPVTTAATAGLLVCLLLVPPPPLSPPLVPPPVPPPLPPPLPLSPPLVQAGAGWCRRRRRRLQPRLVHLLRYELKESVLLLPGFSHSTRPRLASTPLIPFIVSTAVGARTSSAPAEATNCAYSSGEIAPS